MHWYIQPSLIEKPASAYSQQGESYKWKFKAASMHVMLPFPLEHM